MDEILSLYLDLLDSYNYEIEANKEICKDIFRKALKMTSHVARATTTAWATGVCTYAARMMTTIGVRNIILREGVPGKGVDEHKLLALSSLFLIHSWSRDGQLDIASSINRAVQLLHGIIDENRINEIKERVFKILYHLSWLLPQIIKKMNIDKSNLRVYPELQLIDYSTHLWGVPDLVIEEPASKKAIIIDWKTDDASPTQREKYQIYSYAVLEAIRLGYRGFSGIVRAIAPEDPRESKIYVALIRPTHPYSDHPLMPLAQRGNTAIPRNEIEERIKRILISAKFLTALVIDFGMMCCKNSYKNYELSNDCKVRLGQGSYYALRLTPPFLPRGNPRSQNKYPCTVCPYSNAASKLRECEFYFGTTEKDNIDRLMWAFRYRVYRERERAMLPYKALYELSQRVGSLTTLVSDLKNGAWYNVKIANGDVSVYRHTDTSKSRRKLRAHKNKCGLVEVEFEELQHSLDIRVGVYHLEWIGEEAILLHRDFLPCEKNIENEIGHIYVPRERQPVLIVVPENHVTNLTLGTSLYGRVEWVSLSGEEIFEKRCPGICVLVTPINVNLRFQFRLFKNWSQLYGVDEVILAEIGADLTHIDLGTIHSLHMALKYRPEELADEEYEMARRTVEEAWREALSLAM
ncbi:MAG: hypothetical protein QW680_08890 [Pyrobaculum sp.]